MTNNTGWIISFFYNFIVDIADKLADLLESSKLSLNYLITDTSVLNFTMVQGNQFSDNALKIYEILSEIVLIVMVIVFLTVGIRFMFAKTRKQYDTAKSYVKTFIISLFVLLLAIQFLRYVFCIRQVIINVINNAFASGQSINLTERFREELITNDTTKNLANAGLYLSFQIMTLCFAFAYGNISFSMIILIGMLPIMLLSLNSYKFKRMFDRWSFEFISAMAVPVVDVILFNIIFAILPNQTVFLQMMFIGLIMPTRNYIKKLFGVNNHSAAGNSVRLLKEVVSFARGMINVVSRG